MIRLLSLKEDIKIDSLDRIKFLGVSIVADSLEISRQMIFFKKGENLIAYRELNLDLILIQEEGQIPVIKEFKFDN